MEIEKLKKYCEMFNAAWKLFKTYHAAERDEDMRLTGCMEKRNKT